jgi:hypothetical protein
MTKQTRFTNEILLYSLIFFLGLAVRLILLGSNPLTERESVWAYQAWEIWKGLPVRMGSLVSYLSVTEGLFAIFGSSNFSARLWPALTGSALIWIPYLSRKHLGRIPALIMAGGLALDAALVPNSRIAGSPIPGLIFLLLTGISFHQRRIPWSIFFLFFGLTSGPSFWFGVLALGVTLLIAWGSRIFDLRAYLQNRIQTQTETNEKPLFRTGEDYLPIFLILCIASFFFTQLEGLSAWASSLSEFFLAWRVPSGISVLKVLAALLIYNPMIIVFGGLGFVSAWRNNSREGKLLSIWAGISLLLVLVYPGRDTTDLIWVVIPFWASTAQEIFRLYRLSETRWYTSVLAGLLVVLFALNWLTFTGMVFQITDQQTALLHWGLIAASFALAFVAMTIVASEWGWPAAKKGALLGIASVLMIYSLSVMSWGSYLTAGDPRSLWTNGTGSGQMDILLDTISDISVAETGRWDSIEGAVINPSSSMLWILRGLRNFQYYETFDPGNLAPIIITRDVDNLMIPPDLYRGQDFVLLTRPGWNGIFPDDWISWIAFRKGPLQKEYLILWVRSDIISGN